MDPDAISGLLVAALGGAAVGLERQWSGHATGPHARFGGIRTFTLLGALAGLAGWLSLGPLRPAAIVLLAAAAALVLVSYAAASRTDIDATSEAAALVVLGAATLAGAGYLAPASAIFAAMVLLLVEKTRLHALVARIDDAALRASVRFAAMACIVLPLLPSGPYGPLDAIRPRELWAMVLFFSGLSFLGWLARRAAGPGQGTIVSGLLGGVVSSTSVTLQFARDSRPAGAPRFALGAGAVGACTVMLARVTLACVVLNPPLARTLPFYAGPAFLVGAIVVLLAWKRTWVPAAATEEEGTSPLQLRSALQMAGLFQLVLFAIVAVQLRFGSTALVATSAFVGLTDLDALTLSLARSTPAGEVAAAAVALVAGILSNTFLKLTTALVVGRGAFRAMAAAGLGGMAAALVAMLLL
ncbi:MAG: DUF4010 domain-containing protein [Acidimicrobiia bacterium]|nr:DUF4010 domain-containing protein [Acidimicrobiia bacterium]